MNGEPLPIHHGFPLRLIVPSWYAVASVRWLTDIELIEQPFAGHFQMEKYWYEWRRGSEDAREPVTPNRAKSALRGARRRRFFGSESHHYSVVSSHRQPSQIYV